MTKCSNFNYINKWQADYLCMAKTATKFNFFSEAYTDI